MGAFDNLAMHMFGRPVGLLGRCGGVIMAKMNRPYSIWAINLFDVRQGDCVLDVGFGPGVGVQLLAESARARYVAGVDPSQEMLKQATVRNAQAIARGQVDLRTGSAGSLPFGDGTFDKVFTANSLQMWPDAAAGLAEVKRVMKPGGKVAFVFTRHSGQQQGGVVAGLNSAGFVDARTMETEGAFCVFAVNP